MPVALDGGWGWAVVIGSFFCQLIADGCAFSFGILYVELLDYFGESKSKTAWIGSLFIAVPLITGPIAGVLTSRYGCRVITVIGGLIAGIGCVMSSQANSIPMLCVSFGLVAGFGLSMVYMPAVVVITHYFDAKLGLATGIAVAGSGIGTFLFALITDLLIQHYGWRGTMLILGAIMFHICVCGMLFRPVSHTPPAVTLTVLPHKGSLVSLNKPHGSLLVLNNDRSLVTDKQGSVLSLQTQGPVILLANTVTCDHPEEGWICNELNMDDNENNNLGYKQSDTSDTQKLEDTQSKFTSVNSLRKIFQSVDFTVLLDPSFRYFCLSIFLLYISYDIPYIFTPDKAIQMGISEEKASFLVSIIGITSTFGQIAVGIIGDLPGVNTIVLYNTFTIIAGLFTLLVPWYTNYALLCMFAACYGIFISANYTLVSVILVNLLGVEAFTHAYAFEVLAEGMANIIGPPFGGWLTDVTGSYDVTFLVNGSIMIVSGTMLFAMPCFSRRQLGTHQPQH